MTLGDHLRKQQLDLELLQRQIAEKLGVNKGTIVNWECKATTPALHVVPRNSQCPTSTALFGCELLTRAGRLTFS